MSARQPAFILSTLILCCSGRTSTHTSGPEPLKKVEPPAAKPAAGTGEALTYSLDLEIDNEHGCSQSHESTGVDAELVLQVSPDDEATLTLHLHSTSVFGPSFSKFQQGENDFYTTYSEEQSVWTGTAKRSGSRISIAFDHVETSSYEVHGYGGELPPPVGSTSSLTLLCTTSTVPVYAALEEDEYFWDVEGKTPEPTDVVLCKPSDEILGWLHDMALVDGGIPLGSPPGIAMLSSRMFYSESQVIRHAR